MAASRRFRRGGGDGAVGGSAGFGGGHGRGGHPGCAAGGAGRHAIAGNGLRTQRYAAARYNPVVDNALSHGFDMHGENETLGTGAPYAGDAMHIAHNSFRSAAQPAIVIRGRPFTGAWVSGNCFAHSTSDTAVRQRFFTGNLNISANTYATTTGTCHLPGTRRPVAWQLSAGGTGAWSPLAPYTYRHPARAAAPDRSHATMRP